MIKLLSTRSLVSVIHHNVKSLKRFVMAEALFGSSLAVVVGMNDTVQKQQSASSA